MNWGSLHSLRLCILCSLCMCQYVLFECVPKLSQLGDLRIVVQVAVVGVVSTGMCGSPVALHTLPCVAITVSLIIYLCCAVHRVQHAAAIAGCMCACFAVKQWNSCNVLCWLVSDAPAPQRLTTGTCKVRSLQLIDMFADVTYPLWLSVWPGVLQEQPSLLHQPCTSVHTAA